MVLGDCGGGKVSEWRSRYEPIHDTDWLCDPGGQVIHSPIPAGSQHGGESPSTGETASTVPGARDLPPPLKFPNTLTQVKANASTTINTTGNRQLHRILFSAPGSRQVSYKSSHYTAPAIQYNAISLCSPGFFHGGFTALPIWRVPGTFSLTVFHQKLYSTRQMKSYIYFRLCIKHISLILQNNPLRWYNPYRRLQIQESRLKGGERT